MGFWDDDVNKWEWDEGAGEYYNPATGALASDIPRQQERLLSTPELGKPAFRTPIREEYEPTPLENLVGRTWQENLLLENPEYWSGDENVLTMGRGISKAIGALTPLPSSLIDLAVEGEFLRGGGVPTDTPVKIDFDRGGVMGEDWKSKLSALTPGERYLLSLKLKEMGYDINIPMPKNY